MKLLSSLLIFISSTLQLLDEVEAFASSLPQQILSSGRVWTPLHVSIGLGPDTKHESDDRELVEGLDYEVPNHEEYRLTRRSKLDEQCDMWFSQLLDNTDDGVLTSIGQEYRKVLTTPVALVNDIEKPTDDEEWTPHVSTRLPWTVLHPAYGLEQFGLPIPRRNAETWRQFDVSGMVYQSYSGKVLHMDQEIQFTDDQELQQCREHLYTKGGWLDDSECEARLIYINGRYVPQLSKPSDVACNVNNMEQIHESHQKFLARLTDGFTDELAVPVPNNNRMETSYQKLSRPNHCVGAATTQFAINTQQGTACFTALNSIKTNGVAYVHAATGVNEEVAMSPPLPVLIVNAVTRSGDGDGTDMLSEDKGVVFHPRTLVVADEASVLSVVQSCVDLDYDDDCYNPKLYNGYTQFFIKAGANVTHSYLDETGGLVTPNIEKNDDQFEENDRKPRDIEAQRKALKDTHLEAIDVHLIGESASYQGTVMSIGGSGRVRIAVSATLLQPGAFANINGFSLSGGTQRTDIKTNIHHIAQGTTSRQIQKNMIGGRATGSFRGRIRVEQSAQQTDSQQLSRTVLLSDKSRAWAVPSLEIVADDVQCTHGATVSDLSEEELFYLRSRGLDVRSARNLLMFAFAGNVIETIDKAILGNPDAKRGLRHRIVQRLENLVPLGARAVKDYYQSI